MTITQRVASSPCWMPSATAYWEASRWIAKRSALPAGATKTWVTRLPPSAQM